MFCGGQSAAAIPSAQESAETPAEEALTEEAPVTVPPSAPTPDHPVDTETTEMAGFYWKPSENAEHYEVSWKRSDGTEGTTELKADDGTCAAGLCITYEQLPGDGSYNWKVSAVNEAGTTGSEEMAFTVSTGIPSPEAIIVQSE